MEETLALMAEQNERMLSLLEQISDKLDSLASVEMAVENLAADVREISTELQWHKELTFAARLIESVDDVRAAVQGS